MADNRAGEQAERVTHAGERTLWALGSATSTSIGVAVETQYAVFGSTGALVVTAATAVPPMLLAARAARSAS